MATFGNIVKLADVSTRGGGRDNAALEPYKDAIRALQSAGPDSAAMLTEINNADEMRAEKARLRAAGRAVGVVIGMGVQPDKRSLAYWIEAGKTPKPSYYETLSAEAKAAGLTVSAYRALKASERKASANGSDAAPGRGRPRKEQPVTA